MNKPEENLMITQEEENLLKKLDGMRDDLQVQNKEANFTITNIEYYNKLDIIPGKEEFFIKRWRVFNRKSKYGIWYFDKRSKE